MTSVELFCGHGNVSSSLNAQGFTTWKTDIRKRAGVCVPDFQSDILKLTRTNIPFNKINVLWASIPCDVFSNASGNFYLTDYGRLGESAQLFVRILKKSLDLISEINPDLYFIENPKGRMRYQKSMVDFLAKHNGTIKECTLSSYGFPTTKPTDIFTNAHDLNLLPSAPFGRGAKCSGDFQKLTICNRQQTPTALADAIAKYCTHKLRSCYEFKSPVLPSPVFLDE